MAIIKRPEAVKTIQEMLDKLGYDAGNPDGVWGTDTSRGFNYFVHDIQSYMFADKPEERDGLYGGHTNDALKARIAQMYGDRLSADDIARLTGALDQMVEKTDAHGRPDPNGHLLIDRLHRPAELTGFESRITPRPVEAAPAVQPSFPGKEADDAVITLPEITVTPEDKEPDPVVTEPVVSEPEEILVNGQPALALPENEPENESENDRADPGFVAGAPLAPAFADGLSDAEIVAQATELTRRATDSLQYGAIIGLGGNDNGQMDALSEISMAEGDPKLTADASVHVLGRVVDNLDLQERNLVAGNRQLSDYVRASFPDVADTPEAVAAKLREPGVVQGLLDRSDAPDGNPAGEHALLRQFAKMEGERLGAVRVQSVMTAEQQRLSQPAPAVVETHTEPTPQEKLLSDIAVIDQKEEALLRSGFPNDPPEGRSGQILESRIANMRDPVKFARYRAHMLDEGNLDAVQRLDEFQAQETARNGLLQQYETLTGEPAPAEKQPPGATNLDSSLGAFNAAGIQNRIDDAFAAVEAQPENPDLKAALEKKAAEMRAQLGAPGM
jgi:hypothetical protein